MARLRFFALIFVLLYAAPVGAQGGAVFAPLVLRGYDPARLPPTLVLPVLVHVEAHYGDGTLVRTLGEDALGDVVPVYDTRGAVVAYAAHWTVAARTGYTVVDTSGRVLESAEGDAQLFFECAGRVVRLSPLDYACRVGGTLLNEGGAPVVLDFPAPLAAEGYRIAGLGLGYFGTGYVENVPDWSQFVMEDCLSGCGPSAAANVIQYWGERTFATRLQDPDLIAILRRRMGTWCQGTEGWTTVAGVADGMSAYTVDRGYAVTVTLNHEPSYADYRSEIDAGRPAVLLFRGHEEYGSHFVTGVGYQDDYFVVHDNRATTGEEVLLSSVAGFDDWRMIAYDVWGMAPVVTNTTPVTPFLAYCVPVSLTTPGLYTFTYTVDNLTAPVAHIHNRGTGIGMGCVYTDAHDIDILSGCLLTATVATCDGGGAGGLCVDNSYTENYSYTVHHGAIELTNPRAYSNVCVTVTSGTVGDVSYIRASSMTITAAMDITRGRCVSCCRNEDPELDDTMWDGDGTFANGVVTLANGAISSTFEVWRNNEFDTPASIGDQFFTWWAEWSTGVYQIAPSGLIWQPAHLEAGTYTVTVMARAVNGYEATVGFTLWGWTHYDRHEWVVTDTWSEIVHAFTVAVDTYDMVVSVPWDADASVQVDYVYVNRAGATQSLSQILAQSVYLPQYALSKIAVVARAATAGTVLGVHVDGRHVGQATLSTNWYTYTDFVFTNEYAGARDVLLNFHASALSETVEIDYLCVSHDGSECIPAAQGGPLNNSFTYHDDDRLDDWSANPDSWYPRWITTSEALFPDTAPWGQVAPYLEQSGSRHFYPNLRVTYAARLPDGVSQTVGTVNSWWSYQGRDWPGVYPRIGGDTCHITSSDRAVCSYEIAIDGEYARLGDYWLHFAIPPRLTSGDPTPVAVIIDDVCVQVAQPTPLATPTPLPTQDQSAPGPPTALPTRTPTPSRTAMPTPLATYTTGPGTPTRTPDATRMYPSATPLATYTPAATYTPLATYTSAATYTPLATYTPAATYTPLPTVTAYPQPTPGASGCCSYCVYIDTTIRTSGDTSYAACDNCATPTAPESPEGWWDWGGWFQWLARWVAWVGGWVAWAVCKMYFVIIAPLLCFLVAWLRFALLWLKANTIDFVVDLLEQVNHVIAAVGELGGAVWGLFAAVVARVMGLFATVQEFVSALASALSESETLEFVEMPPLLLCLWGEFEWLIHNRADAAIPTPYELIITLAYVRAIWANAVWTMQELSE